MKNKKGGDIPYGGGYAPPYGGKLIGLPNPFAKKMIASGISKKRLRRLKGKGIGDYLKKGWDFIKTYGKKGYDYYKSNKDLQDMVKQGKNYVSKKGKEFVDAKIKAAKKGAHKGINKISRKIKEKAPKEMSTMIEKGTDMAHKGVHKIGSEVSKKTNKLIDTGKNQSLIDYFKRMDQANKAKGISKGMRLVGSKRRLKRIKYKNKIGQGITKKGGSVASLPLGMRP